MRDYLDIGPCPCEEDAAQIGEPDFDVKNKAECLKFIRAIKRVCGEPPEGASLVIRVNRHDMGTYREVAVMFDSEDEVAVAYAFMVEEKAPMTWAAAGLAKPHSGMGKAR